MQKRGKIVRVDVLLLNQINVKASGDSCWWTVVVASWYGHSLSGSFLEWRTHQICNSFTCTWSCHSSYGSCLQVGTCRLHVVCWAPALFLSPIRSCRNRHFWALSTSKQQLWIGMFRTSTLQRSQLFFLDLSGVACRPWGCVWNWISSLLSISLSSRPRMSHSPSAGQYLDYRRW